jgi:hypothetical protein
VPGLPAVPGEDAPVVGALGVGAELVVVGLLVQPAAASAAAAIATNPARANPSLLYLRTLFPFKNPS